MTEPKGTRHCPRCSRAIKRADLVVFNAGQLSHHRCFVQNDQTHDPIDQFLRRHYPSAFCAYCLGLALEITHEQVWKFVEASRTGRPFVILLGARCAGCQQPRLTMQAIAHDETPQKFASRSPGRRPRPGR